jgi:murein DD-endopeptidase MepM/ murein hydrolase activator NlpD
MLLKVAHYNQLRSEKDALSERNKKLEEVAREKEIQAASLSSLANEVSEIYGLKPAAFSSPKTLPAVNDAQFSSTVDELSHLRDSAVNGGLVMRASLVGRNATTADWFRAVYAPNMWPIEGRVTSSFGERLDPFNGEGAFHSGIDISGTYGEPVAAAADGIVTYADFMNGYGRLVVVEHGHEITTRYGHLSGFAVTPGQAVRRGDILGYVGLSGRSTGPHLHYEVRIHDAPVNPYKYLRQTVAAVTAASSASSD